MSERTWSNPAAMGHAMAVAADEQRDRSDTEEPVHVLVAKALGWTFPVLFENVWRGKPPEGPYYRRIPLFDTSWAATGPLIEKYWISLTRWNAATGSRAYWYACVWGPIPPSDYRGIGDEGTSERQVETKGYDTPLLAVCHLILALKEAGKL